MQQLVVSPPSARLAPADAPSARVGYFVASHVHPPQVMRLLRTLCTGNATSGGGGCVVVNHDHRVAPLDVQAAERVGNVHVLAKNDLADYGKFGMLAMLLSGLRWMLDNRDFDWAIFLSGQCYPIRPIADIERDLAASASDGYLDCKPVEEWPFRHVAQRYLYQYYRFPKFPGWQRLRDHYIRKNAWELRNNRLPRVLVPWETDQGFRLGWRPMLRPVFNEQFRCYKGSLWWTLRREAVQRLVDRADRDHRLIRYFRRIGFAPLECFATSVLMNDRGDPPLKLVSNDNRRFIRWTNPIAGHPDALVTADVPSMLASGRDFARKLDERKDPHVLDAIDQANMCVSSRELSSHSATNPQNLI